MYVKGVCAADQQVCFARLLEHCLRTPQLVKPSTLDSITWLRSICSLQSACCRANQHELRCCAHTPFRHQGSRPPPGTLGNASLPAPRQAGVAECRQCACILRRIRRCPTNSGPGLWDRRTGLRRWQHNGTLCCRVSPVGARVGRIADGGPWTVVRYGARQALCTVMSWITQD